jgi:hypothetical protein
MGKRPLWAKPKANSGLKRPAVLCAGGGPYPPKTNYIKVVVCLQKMRQLQAWTETDDHQKMDARCGRGRVCLQKVGQSKSAQGPSLRAARAAGIIGAEVFTGNQKGTGYER